MIVSLENIKSVFTDPYGSIRSELLEWDIKYLQKEFSEDTFKGIYEYREGSYEGTGLLIGTIGPDKWFKFYLGHCSCYGPLENISRNPTYTKEDMLKLIDSLSTDWDGKAYTPEVIQEFRDFVINN